MADLINWRAGFSKVWICIVLKTGYMQVHSGMN